MKWRATTKTGRMLHRVRDTDPDWTLCGHPVRDLVGLQGAAIPREYACLTCERLHAIEQEERHEHLHSIRSAA